MLRWVVIFFILAVAAGALGYSGISADLTEIAKMLFYLFAVLFVITGIMRLVQGKPPM